MASDSEDVDEAVTGEVDGRPTPTIWNDEAMWVAFVRHAPKSSAVYTRWRLSGIPTAWLYRAGYRPGDVRVRKGSLP